MLLGLGGATVWFFTVVAYSPNTIGLIVWALLWSMVIWGMYRYTSPSSEHATVVPRLTARFVLRWASVVGLGVPLVNVVLLNPLLLQVRSGAAVLVGMSFCYGLAMVWPTVILAAMFAFRQHSEAVAQQTAAPRLPKFVRIVGTVSTGLFVPYAFLITLARGLALYGYLSAGDPIALFRDTTFMTVLNASETLVGISTVLALCGLYTLVLVMFAHVHREHRRGVASRSAAQDRGTKNGAKHL